MIIHTVPSLLKGFGLHSLATRSEALCKRRICTNDQRGSPYPKEIRIMSVRKHNVLLTRQFLLASCLPCHPCLHKVLEDPSARHFRQDL